MKNKNIKRRDFIKFSLATMLVNLSPNILAQDKTKLIGSRMWPSESYTRITLESSNKLSFKFFSLDNPLRLVVDVEGVEIKNELSELTSKFVTDKYVKNVRVGINRPNVSRIVFELKEKINPQIFTIDPVDNYSYRLVFDLYPEKSVEDAFSELIEKELNKKNQELAKQENKKEGNEIKHGKVFIVALDAGHGGEDPGAIGVTGTYEKDITLSIARKLKSKIDEIPWMKAVLIRDGDYFIPLHERVEKAQRIKADIFISIHADAFINKGAKGSSVFILSEKGATSAANKWLEKKENSADLIGGINFKTADEHLARTLLDLSLTVKNQDSSKLAKAVLHSMGKINDLHSKTIESAGFAVLKSPTIPSILVETAFLSNPEEERKLKSKEHQDKIADAIIKGITKYTNVSA